ncbi:MAG: XdhC/CoxI family protein [Herpetosiphon sp.]
MIFTMLQQALADQRPVALATVINGAHLGAKLLIDDAGNGHGSLGDAVLDAEVRHVGVALIDKERSETRQFMRGQESVDVLIESYPAPAQLVIVGGVHIAMPLAAAAKLLNFRVTVVDPRSAFLTRERFPSADALIGEWPDEALPALKLGRSSAVAILTHDPKLDNPAALAALRFPVRYIGAIGSSKTQAKRRDALREAGVSDEDLKRIHGPIGLPVGAVTPAEIAISIMAEIVAVWRGKQA